MSVKAPQVNTYFSGCSRGLRSEGFLKKRCHLYTNFTAQEEEQQIYVLDLC